MARKSPAIGPAALIIDYNLVTLAPNNFECKTILRNPSLKIHSFSLQFVIFQKQITIFMNIVI